MRLYHHFSNLLQQQLLVVISFFTLRLSHSFLEIHFLFNMPVHRMTFLQAVDYFNSLQNEESDNNSDDDHFTDVQCQRTDLNFFFGIYLLTTKEIDVNDEFPTKWPLSAKCGNFFKLIFVNTTCQQKE